MFQQAKFFDINITVPPAGEQEVAFEKGAALTQEIEFVIGIGQSVET